MMTHKNDSRLWLASLLALAAFGGLGCAQENGNSQIETTPCDATYTNTCSSEGDRFIYCNNGKLAYSDFCKDGCVNGACVDNSECKDTDPVVCEGLASIKKCKDGKFVTEYCGDGKTCTAGICNQDESYCNPLEYPKCSSDGSEIITCVNNHLSTSVCRNGSCEDGKCVKPECDDETSLPKCDGDELKICRNGKYIVDTICGDGCIDGRCLECDPGLDTAVTCSGMELKRCGSDGFWSYETCPDNKVCNAEKKACMKAEKPAVLKPAGDILSEADMDAIVEPASRIYFDLNNIDIYSGNPSMSMDGFLRFPYPSALRTNEKGQPSLKGLRLPMEGLWIIDIVKDAVQNKRAGFSPQGAIYMRSTVALDASKFPSVAESIDENSCAQLVNVEKALDGTKGPHFGQRVPVYVSVSSSSNTSYTPSNTIIMRPAPGLAMWPGEQYAAVITNDCLKATSGVVITQSNKLARVLDLTAPASYTKHYTPVIQSLVDLGFVREKIYGFTSFTTSDVAAEMDLLVKDAVGKGSIVADSNGYATGSWSHYGDVADIFIGSFKTPNYITKGGTIDYTINSSGKPKLAVSPTMETVQFAISIPKSKDAPMPEDGYPLIIYGHGTGGDAVTHCRSNNDEGIQLLKQKVPVAMLGFDACLQGARTQNGSLNELSDIAALMTSNPIVIVESVRQTTLDMTVLYELLEAGKIVLPPRDASEGPIRFNNKFGMYMGHSQGSQEAGLLLGVESRIKNAFLSAGGGGLSIAFTSLKVSFDTPVLSAKDETFAEVLAKFLNLTGLNGTIDIDTFITQQIAQPLLDPIDPLNFAYRFVREPKDMEPKNIAMTTGLNDESTPMYTQFALATAIGLPTVGKQYIVSDSMKIAGFGTPMESPASDNVDVNVDNKIVTGGSMQFDPAPIGKTNPHFVIYYHPSAINTFPDFFESVVVEGKPKIIVNDQN